MPEQEKPFKLDKGELTKEVPFMAKGIVGGLIDWINSRDFNHDGVPDIAQAAPLVIKALPIAAALAPLIDWDKVKDEVLSKFCHDPEQAERLLDRVLDLVSQFKQE